MGKTLLCMNLSLLLVYLKLESIFFQDLKQMALMFCWLSLHYRCDHFLTGLLYVSQLWMSLCTIILLTQTCAFSQKPALKAKNKQTEVCCGNTHTESCLESTYLCKDGSPSWLVFFLLRFCLLDVGVCLVFLHHTTKMLKSKLFSTFLQSVPICCWPTMHLWRWRMLRDGARLLRPLATEIDKWVSLYL